MKICHVCGKECEDNFELCPVCGAILRENFSDETENETVENPVFAVSVEDVVTAEIYRDMLKENGIRFAVGENETNIRLTFGGGFVSEEIYVDEKDLDRAKEIYEEVLNAEPSFEDFFDDETEEE